MTARETRIRALTEDDAREAGRVAADALMVEPGYAAVMPDEDIRRRVMRTMMTESIRQGHHDGTILGAFVDARVLGVAIWSSPGTGPGDTDVDGHRDIPHELRDIDPAVFHRLAEYDAACMRHLPPEPFWYLQALAVDPAGQGKGIGSALLEASFELIGEDAHPAYLETGTEQNVRFYERFGFQVREADVQLAPGSTPHWTMIRPAIVTSR